VHVNNVERVVCEIEVVYISNTEVNVGDSFASSEIAGLIKRIWYIFYARDVALGYAAGKVDAD
jgi:hypothetical protein